MRDLLASIDNRSILEALRPASAPSAFQQHVRAATDGLDVLTSRISTLAVFGRMLPLADIDPLAALHTLAPPLMPDASSAKGAAFDDDSAAADQGERADRLAWLRKLSQTANNHDPRRPGVTSETLAERRSAHGPTPLAVLSSGASHQRRSVPASERTTLPVDQLAMFAGASGQQAINRGARGRAGTLTSQSRAPMQPVLTSVVSPLKTGGLAPTATAPSNGLAAADHASTMLVARLVEPGAQQQTSGVEPPEFVRSVMAQAFDAPVQAGVISEERLLDWAAGRMPTPMHAGQCLAAAGNLLGDDGVSSQNHRSTIGESGAAGDRLRARPAGRFGDISSVETALLPLTHPAAFPTPIRSSPREEHVGADEATSARASAPPVVPGARISDAAPEMTLPPAAQNTFNVTVHLAGGLDGHEDALAERLNRILIEQARRNGIDV